LKSKRVLKNNTPSFEPSTRRIVFVAGPRVEILDLVGPLQVFARASETHARENPGSAPIYSVEVVTISSRRSLIANCGLRVTADRTFRKVRGKIDTLLVAGGDAIEQNEISLEAVRWLKKSPDESDESARSAPVQCSWPAPACSTVVAPRLTGTGVRP
jgi:transcriptional regulator GlxA family with amidase domain